MTFHELPDSPGSITKEVFDKKVYQGRPTRRGPESRDWGVPGQSKSQEELVHQHTTELGGQPGFEPTVWTSSSDPARAGNFDITTETTYSQFGASNWNRFLTGKAVLSQGIWKTRDLKWLTFQHDVTWGGSYNGGFPQQTIEIGGKPTI